MSIGKTVMSIFETSKPWLKLVAWASLGYMCWIVSHYIAAHLYVNLCVPATLYGFIASPMMTSLPHCQALRWLIYNGGATINHMWMVIGAYFANVAGK